MYEYPKDLVDLIAEHESEGAEVFVTQNTDGTVFIIKPASLEKWYVLLEWYEGSQKFAHVNLAGKSVERMMKLFIEDGVK